ncbi:MAG: sulfite exporter TauE/SafE family protein [Armatimonadetes bacterium]|nr:sulfite exporter TauE/SafE family protein [Armatimonadota bacterium]
MHWLWLAAGVAGLAQGLTGFGFGIVAMAVLTPVLGPKAANLVVTPLAGMNIAVGLWAVRRSINWRRALPLCCGGLLGTPLGVQILLHADALLLRRLVGVVILLTAIGSFHAAGKPRATPSREWWGFATGALGGVTGGAVAMAGPPVVVYAYRQPWPLRGIKATLLLFFGGTVAARLALLVGRGEYPVSILGTITSMLPLVAAATWAGHRLTDRVPRKQVDRVAAALLTIAGVVLLLPPGRP